MTAMLGHVCNLGVAKIELNYASAFRICLASNASFTIQKGWSRDVKRCQEKRCQEMSRDVKRCQEMSGDVRRCQEMSGDVKSVREVQVAARKLRLTQEVI